jgi:mRNA interferase RelE/StbE
MNVILNSSATKYLKSVNEPNKSRIKEALTNLELEPPQGDIKAMSGAHGEYRLRVGSYRILFTRYDGKILVFEIGTRGQIYKKR